MNRLIGGVVAAAILLVACSAGQTPPAPVVGPTSPSAAAPWAARRATPRLRCRRDQPVEPEGAAKPVANVNPNSDTTSLQTAIGDAKTNLGSLQATGDQTTLKQARCELQSVQSGLNNPSTIAETAASASTALSALDSSLCSS